MPPAPGDGVGNDLPEVNDLAAAAAAGKNNDADLVPATTNEAAAAAAAGKELPEAAAASHTLTLSLADQVLSEFRRDAGRR